ncbi:MAG: T9SS type A sorting domain-containing protein [Chitinophagaceae bacterium]|nr:T9SS type A sorting domain-containing protein [Chitinophagaceae bacterium]
MKFIISLFFLFLFFGAKAQITWSSHIAPILYNKCSSCHHSSGAGHSDLTNYDTAVYNAAAINYYTVQRQMPPWPPNINYKRYAHERVLSQQEIDDIQSWVMNATPIGDTTLLPPKPIYTGSAILTQTPDNTFQMPNFTIPNVGGTDIYWNFPIATNFLTSKFISGFEFLPGNTEQVHHALIYVDSGNTTLNNDAAYLGPGYPGFGGVNSSTAKLIGAFVPGTTPFIFPSAFGMRLPANAVIIFSMHYPAGSVGQMDSSKINLFLAPTATREIFFEAPLNHGSNLINGPLFIPANTTKIFESQYTVPIDISVFGVAPHMHLIGKSIKAFGISPSNDSIPFIDIPNWDFRWQGAYYFQKIMKLSAGTKTYAIANYDNTTANLNNPNNPPLNVSLGENTNDEMLLVYFPYTKYQLGDENIILDSAAVLASNEDIFHLFKKIEFFPCFPNPTSDELILKYYTANLEELYYYINDMQGKTIFQSQKRKSIGYQTEKISLANLPSGTYFITLQTNAEKKVQKVVKE